MKLAAFDFDHTIINVNSDTYIDKLISNDDGKSYKYPKDIDALTKSWTHRMNSVFDLLHKDFNIKKDDFIKCLHQIKIDDEMKQLISNLSLNNYKIIIISDSNSIFIEEILRANNLLDIFQFQHNKIFTNSAQFDDNQKLIVKPFNETVDIDNVCKSGICATNMCKGTILQHYLKTTFINEQNEKIIYVGDGHNDYCPGLFLTQNDSFLVRNKYSLQKMLFKDKQRLDRIKANILYWDTAKDINEKISF
jgi:pyridoxal phosphate phosphatase PHOSPHO2